MAWLQDDVMSGLLSPTDFSIWRPEVDVCEKKWENYHKSASSSSRPRRQLSIDNQHKKWL
jgi:hypothetical protein